MTHRECIGVFGRIFGHAYEPIWELGPPTITDVEGRPSAAIALVEASKPAKYIGSVCMRCGSTIRPDQP